MGEWDLLVLANVCGGILFMESFSWAPGIIHGLEQNVRRDLTRAATGKGTQRKKGGRLRDWCKFAEKRNLRLSEAS